MTHITEKKNMESVLKNVTLNTLLSDIAGKTMERGNKAKTHKKNNCSFSFSVYTKMPERQMIHCWLYINTLIFQILIIPFLSDTCFPELLFETVLFYSKVHRDKKLQADIF